jgi:hypothetical protein
VFGVLALVAAGILHPGYYYGHLSGSIEPTQETLNIRALAETCPRWRWVFPRNHAYQYVGLTRQADENWELHIYPASRTWRLGDETGVLDADALDRLMPADRWAEPNGATRGERLAHLLSVLESLGNGTFYPTNHDEYVFEKPFPARYQHFTLGIGLGLALVLGPWCAIWLVFLVVRGKAYRGVRASPGKVYLVTLGVVAAADALWSLVYVMLSPGPVAELMELLLGLVNLPGLILLSNDVLTSIIYITSAMLWATLVSIIAALRARRQMSAPAEAR